MTFNNDSWIEGTPGEHMIATNTKDNGKSWSEFVPIAAYSDNNTHGECSRRPSSLGLSCVVTPISCSVRVRVSNPPLCVRHTNLRSVCRLLLLRVRHRAPGRLAHLRGLRLERIQHHQPAQPEALTLLPCRHAGAVCLEILR